MTTTAGRGLALALLLVGGRAAWGEVGGTWKPMGAVDYFGAGDRSAHAEGTARADCGRYRASGAATCAAAVTGAGAFGGRAGVVYSSRSGYAGASVGYAFGGPTAARTVFTVTPTGSSEVKVTNRMVRFLLEDGQRFDLGDGWGVALGVAGGLALVHESKYCASTGSLAGTCAANGYPDSRDRSWPTWEVGPALFYGPFEMAVRYVGFARRAELPWNTFGLSAGLRF